MSLSSICRFGLTLAVLASVACTVETVAHEIKSGDNSSGTKLRDASDGDTFESLGAKSCMSVACHGRAEPDTYGRIRGNEYSIWVENDPHAKAFETLYSDCGQKMMAALGICSGDTRDKGFQNCLGCHSPLDASEAQHDGLGNRDGVSCDACHGTADNWIALHYEPQWKQLDSQKKRDLGMLNTDDLRVRAQVCADCHVGSREGTVNHDLIAAGHPQLKFELASYSQSLPEHWDDARERTSTAHFELQLWAQGQLASTQAALKLLHARSADAADSTRGDGSSVNTSVWPEFAEYDCVGCHRNLFDAAAHGSSLKHRDRIGQLVWAPWYYTMTLGLAKHVASDQFGRLREIMQRSYAPDPAKVHETATELIDWVNLNRNSILSDLGAAPIEPKETVKRLMVLSNTRASECTDLAKDTLSSNWDVAAQIYLAVAALNVTVQDESYKRLQGSASVNDTALAELRLLRKMLSYPNGDNSPSNVTPDHFRRLRSFLDRFEDPFAGR